MKKSNINIGSNNERVSFDVSSDYCEIVNDGRQVNTLQGATEQVRHVNETRQVAYVPMQLNESVVRVTTEPRTTRNVWIRLKQYKRTILTFVCSVILTLVIVVPVMVSTSSSPENDNEAGYLFFLKFDRDSTHSAMFLSDDNTVLGNSFTKETPNPVNHPEQFNTYKGTIGDRCLTSTSKIYFDMKFSYELLKSLTSNDIVVEVGVASREKIDTHHFVGKHGWSFVIQDCNTSICLTANHHVANIDDKVKVISSSNTAGTVATGRLGLFINMNRNEFSVIDKDSSKILYTLRKVVSADQLCLAFGVYNPSYLQGKLEIMYSYDFINLPIINVVA